MKSDKGGCMNVHTQCDVDMYMYVYMSCEYAAITSSH